MADAIPQGGFQAYDQHIVTGGEYLRQKRVNEARAQFESALALRPDDSKALGLLGLTLFQMAAFEDALPVYSKLVEQSPNDSSLRLNLGLVHLKLGNADGAIAELTRCRELDPGQTRAVSYLGLAYARNGDYASAYQAFLQAGQADLAREMEQYLSAEARAAIVARVNARVSGQVPAQEPVPAADAVPAPVDEGEESKEIVIESAEALSESESEADVDEGEVKELPADTHEESPLEDKESGAVKEASDGRSAVSLAVESALPSASAAASARRTADGHLPPTPLSEFATSRLIRPEDGEHPFEISAGGVLIVRVDGRVMSRTEGVIVSGGELAYEPATRRVRGEHTGEPFGADGRPLFFVTGKGHLVAAPLGEHFAAVMLDDDILYVREDLVFAFEERLRWENGHVPGSRGTINMVQFRGEGAVSIRTGKPLLSVKLAPDRVVYVDVDALAGWIGRVVPRVVQPAAGGKSSATFVECAGEGVVLLDDNTGVSHGEPAAPATQG